MKEQMQHNQPLIKPSPGGELDGRMETQISANTGEKEHFFLHKMGALKSPERNFLFKRVNLLVVSYLFSAL